jgi:uncharacterized cupin superfamily protein
MISWRSRRPSPEGADYTCPLLRGAARFGRFAAAELRLIGLSPIIHIGNNREHAMRKTISRAVRTLGFAALAAVSLSTFAADKPAVTPATGTLSFSRLYTGPDGVSHWADETVHLASRGTESIEAMMATAAIGDVKGAMVAMLKAGATEDWHVAPRRQFMVCLRGLVEVTAADGQVRRLKPGEFALLEDLSGKGHITHSAGKEDHVALALPIPDSAFPKK